MKRSLPAQVCLLLVTFLGLNVRSIADVQVECGGDEEENIIEIASSTECDTLARSHRRALQALEAAVLAGYPDVHCMNGDCLEGTCLPTVVFVSGVTYTDHYDAVNDCYTSDAKVNGKIYIHCTTCTVI